MKNLNVLLKLKSENIKFVVQNEQGQLVPMANNAKGVVKNVDETILFELFGETTLSDANIEAFKQLKRVKLELPKANKKEKEKEKKV